MKTLVVYYSYTGNVKKLAQRYAENESANILEISDVRRPMGLMAYSLGCFAAIKGKAWPIQPFSAVLGAYDNFVLFFPVWASNPPPAFNTLLEQLPNNIEVSFKAVSRSGRSSCKGRLATLIKEKNGIIKSFEDIKL